MTTKIIGSQNSERSSVKDKKSKESKKNLGPEENQIPIKNCKVKKMTEDETVCKTLDNVDTTNFSLVKIQIESCAAFGEVKSIKNCSNNDKDDKKLQKGSRSTQNNESGLNSTESDKKSECVKHVSKKCCSSNNAKQKYNKKSKNSEKKEVLEAPPNSSKKPSCSPFKKLSRSSLTIEPDKITVNMSKYSPCASRLAASSKIMSTTSPTSPDSPLRVVRSRSPSNFNRNVNAKLSSRDTSTEKSTIQASLSLNIHQFQKSSNSSNAPRSKSVGDSCVTSPTSEETTTSCSPTGTEILSLDEVGVINLTKVESPKRVSTAVGEAKKSLLTDFQECGNNVGCNNAADNGGNRKKISGDNNKTKKSTLETKC